MKFSKINKLILFGGTRLIFEFAKSVKKEKFEITVFSSKRHLDEIVEGSLALGNALKKAKIRFYNSPNINKDINLKKEIVPGTLGIAFGAAWAFEKKTAGLFQKNHFLDFMGIDLPRYRGGAHYTWQILHQNRTGSTNLQIIYGGQDTFHKGEVIKRKNYFIPKSARKPKDYFHFMGKEELAFLDEFLGQIRKGKGFTLKKLNEDESSYYPFLNTKLNGLIDWRWSDKDICLFISAFDEPYAGASTFLRGKKVFLKDCELLKTTEKFHPFTSGIVMRKNIRGVFVAVSEAVLLVKKIIGRDGEDMMKSVNLGDRFFTPGNELDNAMSFGAVYGAGGLMKSKNKNS